MIKLIKPNFWNKKTNIFTVILIPFSVIYYLLITIKKRITKLRSFEIPIICVGNIYAGGTGKTPISIHIAKELLQKGMKPVILRKFYKNHNDEYKLIKNKFKNLLLDKNRLNALNKLQVSDHDVVILDDGLQDYRIKKDLKIVCFNQNQLIGNGFILPSGPLREGLGALKDVDMVLINGDKDEKFTKKILDINNNLRIFYYSYEPVNLGEFKNKKLFAIAGIAHPENFFQLLESNKLKVEKKLIFPDHYNFSRKEIEEILREADSKNFQIIMTEKDYFKINHFNLERIKYLKIILKISKQEKFIDEIRKLIQ